MKEQNEQRLHKKKPRVMKVLQRPLFIQQQEGVRAKREKVKEREPVDQGQYMVSSTFALLFFLVACTRLYKSLCRSVGLLVPLVRFSMFYKSLVAFNIVSHF